MWIAHPLLPTWASYRRCTIAYAVQTAVYADWSTVVRDILVKLSWVFMISRKLRELIHGLPKPLLILIWIDDYSVGFLTIWNLVVEG